MREIAHRWTLMLLALTLAGCAGSIEGDGAAAETSVHSSKQSTPCEECSEERDMTIAVPILPEGEVRLCVGPDQVDTGISGIYVPEHCRALFRTEIDLKRPLLMISRDGDTTTGCFRWLRSSLRECDESLVYNRRRLVVTKSSFLLYFGIEWSKYW